MHHYTWTKYNDSLNKEVSAQLKRHGWDKTIPELEGKHAKYPSLEPLFRHIALIINRFLEDEEPRYLFIKIPVEELAPVDYSEGEANDKTQLEAYNLFSGMVLGCLATATAPAFKTTLHPRFTSHELGEGYEENQHFCCLHEGSDLYATTKRGQRGPLKLCFERKFDHRIAFERCDKDSFLRIAQKPKQAEAEYNKIKKEAELADALPELSRRYESATFVVNYDPENPKIPEPDGYLVTPYNLQKEFDSHPERCSRDILVFMGDKTYRDRWQEVRNGKTKKIIFIGTDYPDQDKKTLCYELTPRELHNSIRLEKKEEREKKEKKKKGKGKKKGHKPQEDNYKPAEVCELDFPWLEESASELRSKLKGFLHDGEALSPKQVNRLISYLTAPMLRAEFDAEELERIKEADYVYTLSSVLREGGESLRDELIELVEDWLEGLSFEGQNPKREWMEQNPGYMPALNNKGYIRKRDIRRAEPDQHKFVISSLSIYKNDISATALGYILRHRVRPEVKVLYYKGLEEVRLNALNSYHAEEECILGAELRRRWTLALEQPKNEKSAQAKAYGKAELDEEQGLLEASLLSYTGSSSSSRESYKVISTDGENPTLSGEVLWAETTTDAALVWRRMTLEDLYDKLREPEEAEEEETSLAGKPTYKLRYYKNPDSLGELLELEHEKEVERMSELWKDRLKEERDKRKSKHRDEVQAREELSRELGLTPNMVAEYVSETKNKFLRGSEDMKRVCRKLIDWGRLNEEQGKHIMLMRRLHKQNVRRGKELKSALFALLTGEMTDTSELEGWLKKGVSLKELLAKCIVEIEVKSIEKGKHGDEQNN